MVPYFILAPFALLLTAITAIPLAQLEPVPGAISRNPHTPPVIFHAKRDSVNDCGDSTFVQFTTPFDSPLVEDCRTIAKNIAGGGTWSVETITGNWHQLVQYGTCAFAVRCSANIAFVKLGNQDIVDVITHSIDRFAEGGKIAAQGEMRCQSGISYPLVGWAVYQNGKKAPGTTRLLQ